MKTGIIITVSVIVVGVIAYFIYKSQSAPKTTTTTSKTDASTSGLTSLLSKINLSGLSLFGA